MRIWKSNVFSMSGLFVILSQLTLSPSALARDSELVVPIGALAHAATAVEASTGGRLMEIRLADEKGKPTFEAALAKDGAVLYMRIDSVNDHVTEINVRDLPEWLLNYPLEAYMRSIDKAELPLAEAIVRAEERASAPAIDAGLAEPLSGTNAVLAYLVETIKGSRRHVLAVDAKSGDFIANPEALYAPHSPVILARRLMAAARATETEKAS
jgi:uncharacterized membrane protein YkoI